MKSMTSSHSWFRLRVRSTPKLERRSWLASVRYHGSADPSAIRPGRLALHSHSPSRHANVPEGSTVLNSRAERIARSPPAWRSLSHTENEFVPYDFRFGSFASRTRRRRYAHSCSKSGGIANIARRLMSVPITDSVVRSSRTRMGTITASES
jgi:hypothetical protein